MIGPVSTAWSERDATGLTDRAYLDVLGLCVSTAIVAWLLYELATQGTGVLPTMAAIAFFATGIYLVSWVEELFRQTLIYAGTWRYGGPV